MSIFNDNPDFWPSTPQLARQVVGKISKDAAYFLEPNGGDGAIAKVARGFDKRHVDCIESDPRLASVLRDQDFNVVGHDFLTYEGVCFYDAIVMNPPFSQGAKMLLRAWDFLYAGEISCLLNAETLNNPHTEERRRLVKLIEEHGTVENLGQPFTTAARKTDVDVVLVYLHKTAADDSMDVWANLTEEREADDSIGEEPNHLAVLDKLGNMQHYYDSANAEFFKACQHLRRAASYMNANGIALDDDYIKVLAVATKNLNSGKAAFVKAHSKESWGKVMGRLEFRKWLDKKQTEEMLRSVERDSCIPFTKENIKGTLENIILSRAKLFEISVANVFDSLTKFHAENTVHPEGWKSNENYKVNKRIVFPYGCRCTTYRFGREKSLSWNLHYSHSECDVYNDIDRILCVLDGKDFTECRTVEYALRDKFQSRPTPSGVSEQITESEYFTVRFWQKGTVHLIWKRQDLLDKFNVKAAAGKKWLGSNTQRGSA